MVKKICYVNSDLLECVKDNFEYKDTSRIIYFCDCITRKYIQNEQALNTAIELPNEFFEDKLASARGLKKKIMDLGILELFKDYSTVSHKCKSYKFGDDYCDLNKLVEHTVRIKKRTKTKREPKTEDFSCTLNKTKDILQKIELSDMGGGMSIEEYVSKCGADYHENILSKIDLPGKKYLNNENKFETIKGCLDTFIADKISLKMSKDIMMLRRLETGNIYASRNETNRRLDSNLTNLRKLYTNKFTLAGEKLINIDLACSQFCLLANIITDNSSNHIKFDGLEEKFSRQLKTLYFKSLLATIIKHGATLDEYKIIKEYYNNKIHYIEQYNEDITYIINNIEISNNNNINFSPIMSGLSVNKFLINALSGRLYEYIGEVLDNEHNRDFNKKLAFELLFGLRVTNHQIDNETSEYKIKFREEFNYIFTIVNEFKNVMVNEEKARIPEDAINTTELYREIVKSQDGKVLKSKEGYARVGSSKLSILLQRIESYIFIDNILPRLYEADIDALSIHDSFLIPESKYHAAKAIIVEEFKKFLPYGFTLKSDNEGKISYIPCIEIEERIAV
jgi:hypothetical protein